MSNVYKQAYVLFLSLPHIRSHTRARALTLSVIGLSNAWFFESEYFSKTTFGGKKWKEAASVYNSIEREDKS